MRVSVIGGGRVDAGTAETAEVVGRLLARRGHTVVCGGLGGVMEAACKGASEAGGRTIGILPGEDPGRANRYVETAVATGLGDARNALVALNGECAIAVDGAAGTLSEIGHVLAVGNPVAGIDTHRVDLPGFAAVDTPEEAVTYVETHG